VFVGACTALVVCDGGGAGLSFGMMPALAELVRSRTSRETPRDLRIAFPFEVMGANQSRRRILLRYGGFAAYDQIWSYETKGGLT
jgi:hypothetical protein